MSLHSRLTNAAQTMLGVSTQNGQDPNDGAPPTQVTPTNNELPPAPAVGAKPGLLDKLEGTGTTGLSIATWNLLDEGKSEEEARDDLQTKILDPSSNVFTLWMSPDSAQVAVGHSPFVYISEKGKEDPHNRCGIVFLKDRLGRGDPGHGLRCT